MPRTIEQIRLGLDDSLEEKLALLAPGYASYHITRKSVDARGRVPQFVYAVEVYSAGEAVPERQILVEPVAKQRGSAPVIIVGAGPAGLFAALRLVERGVPCRLLEQGSEANRRMRGIADYWRTGTLHPRNNVCFGEGGAGLYSDGKLITRIRSEHIPYVLNRLVKFGAPPEIEYVANPHVGSDKIRKVIPPLREFLRANGCEVRFDTKVAALEFEGQRTRGVRLDSGECLAADAVILATGHSATDVLQGLSEQGVALEGKSFAMGLRIEHPQLAINQMQYGDFASHPKLGAANYRLADHDNRTGIGVYSFCMCPGGYVIASSTEATGVVSNGMSNYARNSAFANAAIVVSIDHSTQFGTDRFGGLQLRTQIEQAARQAVIAAGGTKQFPAQRAVDFMAGRASSPMRTSSPSGVVPARLDLLLPEFLTSSLRRGLEKFEKTFPGFLSSEAVLHGVETRTSCPLRVPRDSVTLESVSHAGLYPTGEGAGYAGGITSAAVDGVRVAEAIVQKLTCAR